MNSSTLAPNVGNHERLICTGIGALLVWRGLRDGFGPLLIAGAGAALVQRGLSGHCRVYKAIGVSTVTAPNAPDQSTAHASALAHHYLSDVLRRFKLWAEAADVATTLRQSAGECGGVGQTLVELADPDSQSNAGTWPTSTVGQRPLVAVDIPLGKPSIDTVKVKLALKPT